MPIKSFWVTCVAIGCAAAVTSLHAEERKYTLQDLQSLQTRKAWPELLEHLQDVAPAARTAEWNRVVEASCMHDDHLDEAYTEYCGDSLKSVLESEPTNADFAWKAGKWTRHNLSSWFSVPFFSKVIQKSGDSRCADRDVQLAVVSGLGLPADNHAELVKQSQILAFDLCWPAMKDSVMKEYSGNSYVRDNSCGALKKKGGLSSLQAKRCEAK